MPSCRNQGIIDKIRTVNSVLIFVTHIRIEIIIFLFVIIFM